MRSKTLTIFILCFTIFSLCACNNLHSGLVTGNSVDGPRTDRKAYLEEMSDHGSAAEEDPDYKKQADDYAASRHIPNDMKQAIADLNISFGNMKQTIKNTITEIKKRKMDLNTELPDIQLPSLDPLQIPEKLLK